jgi:hypothetical protein
MRFPLFAGTLAVGLTIGSGCGSANNSGSKLTAFTQQMVAAKRVTIWSTRSNLDGPIGSEFSSVAQIREYMTTGRPPTKSLPYLTKPEAITKSKRDSIAEFFRRVAFERSPEKQHACMFNPATSSWSNIKTSRCSRCYAFSVATTLLRTKKARLYSAELYC